MQIFSGRYQSISYLYHSVTEKPSKNLTSSWAHSHTETVKFWQWKKGRMRRQCLAQWWRQLFRCSHLVSVYAGSSSSFASHSSFQKMYTLAESRWGFEDSKMECQVPDGAWPNPDCNGHFLFLFKVCLFETQSYRVGEGIHFPSTALLFK